VRFGRCRRRATPPKVARQTRRLLPPRHHVAPLANLQLHAPRMLCCRPHEAFERLRAAMVLAVTLAMTTCRSSPHRHAARSKVTATKSQTHQRAVHEAPLSEGTVRDPAGNDGGIPDRQEVMRGASAAHVVMSWCFLSATSLGFAMDAAVCRRRARWIAFDATGATTTFVTSASLFR